MEVKWYARIGIILLLVAVVGLIVFDSNIFNNENVLIKVQGSSIIYLALLSIAIFYENNKDRLIEFYPKLPIGILSIVFFVVSILGLIFIELVSIWGRMGLYIPTICVAALALGLFCATQALKRKK